MRRFCVLTLLLFGILTIIIGFAEMHVHPGTPPVAHIGLGTLLVTTTVVHIILNRKAIFRYLKGTR